VLSGPAVEIERIVTGDGARDEKAQRAADALRAACGYRWVGIYDVTAEEIANIAWSGPGPPAHPRFPRTRGVSAAAVDSGETVVVGDVLTDARYLEALGDTRSEMIVPVQGAGSAVVGTIDVESERVDAFGAEDRQLVERCAAALAPLWS
jgi:L-methionine (R)-S-oxide reductase